MRLAVQVLAQLTGPESQRMINLNLLLEQSWHAHFCDTESGTLWMLCHITMDPAYQWHSLTCITI